MEKEDLKSSELEEKPELVKPVKEKKKFNLPKPILIASAALVLLILLGGAYFLGKSKSGNQTVTTQITASPTPTDETSNWQTYEGDGFSFKYPETAKVLPKYSDYINLQLENGDRIHVFSQANSGNLSARDWLEKEFPQSESAKFEDANISGKDSVQTNDYSGTHINFGGGKILTITFVKCDGPGCGAGTEIETIQKILSTFKFTDSTSSLNNLVASSSELKGFQAEYDPNLWTLEIDDAKACNDVECSASFGKYFMFTSKKYGNKLALSISLVKSTEYKPSANEAEVGQICFKPTDIENIGTDWYSARNPNYETTWEEQNKVWDRYIYMKSDLSFANDKTCIKRGALNFYEQTPLSVKYKNVPTNIYIYLRNSVSASQINATDNIVNSIKFN